MTGGVGSGGRERGHSHEDHGHAHPDQGHTRAHSHDARHAEGHREPLGPEAGRGRILLLDTFSGVAGDMTIAALVDLGVPFSVVQEAVAAIPLTGVALHLGSTQAGSIGATSFHVHVEPGQGERRYADIDAMLANGALDGGTKSLARRMFRRLAEAESEVHRVAIDEVHFHEVGAADAIVDMVGAAACFVYLGADVICTPLPIGRGMVASRHGPLPLPAPATIACLRGAPTYDAGIDAELEALPGAPVFYCRSGETTKALAAKLAQQGSPVSFLEGGVLAWEGAGLPVERPD